jgi:16S rRNA (cytosine1402-N4)-methyltransferase
MNATMLLEKTKHHPVMLDQILSIISPQHGGTFVDCTFGGGGYSEEILRYPTTKVFAIDRDESTKNYANNLKKKFPERFNFSLSKFSNLKKVFNSKLKARGVIFDLGLSSFQLADDKKGFSFKSKGFLSMEMGLNECSAFEAVNNLDKKNLINLIKILGEEKDAKVIVNKIINYRKTKKIKTSEEFASIINKVKKKINNNKKNPATKTFQAIRIFINQELTELVQGLIAATEVLDEDGILIIVSFHSLEDKIVKNFFNLYSNLKRNPSRYLLSQNNKPTLYKSAIKKPLTPSRKEIIHNIRSRSAKLRYGIRNNNSFYPLEDFKKKFDKYFRLNEIKV